MLKRIVGTFTFVGASLAAANDLFAHDGAGAAHFISQTDHTLAIMITIGLVGFAAIVWHKGKKKQV